MAYKKICTYFTLIDQTVYEIITNYFTQPSKSLRNNKRRKKFYVEISNSN